MGEVEVIPFVVKPSSELYIVSAEITIQERSGGCSLCCFFYLKKKMLKEKPRECHNHKPQPIPDTRTEIDACKVNKQMHEKHIDHLSLPQAR